MRSSMTTEWTTLLPPLATLLGAVLYVVGGLRFREWAVDERPGIPRYPRAVETVLLWLVYSTVVSVAIVVVRQTIRDFMA